MIDSPNDGARAGRSHAMLLVIALGVAIAFIRISGPPDLMDNEQQLQSSYVMDAVQNGHWIYQRDDTGQLASKPPMYAWLAGIAALPWPRINRFAMCLPSAAATIAVACLILSLGRKYLGSRAGLLAAVAYLMSAPIVRQSGLARMDGLFPLTVTLGAMAAHAAWTQRRSWVWFFLAGGAITLTKSPMIMLVSAAGLLAAIWEWAQGTPLKIRGWWSIALGVLLFLAIGAGWFAAACWEWGYPAVYGKLIGEELLPQAVQRYKGVAPGQLLYEPPAYVLLRFAPWSVLAFIGLWSVCTKRIEKMDGNQNPADDANAPRRFARFGFFWFVGGLIVFGIAPHQRGDLLLPLYPPAALLAGWELARWLRTCSSRCMATVVGIAIAAGLGFAVWKYQIAAWKDPFVKDTLAVRDLASEIEKTVGKDFPLTHLDSPFALQYYLNTIRPQVTREQAVRLLHGDAAAYVAVLRREKLEEMLADRSWNVYEVAKAPFEQAKGWVRIYSNRPGPIAISNDMAMASGPLEIVVHGLRFTHAAEHDFAFSGAGSVTLTNRSDAAICVNLRFDRPNKPLQHQHTLRPGESWSYTAP